MEFKTCEEYVLAELVDTRRERDELIGKCAELQSRMFATQEALTEAKASMSRVVDENEELRKQLRERG